MTVALRFLHIKNGSFGLDSFSVDSDSIDSDVMHDRTSLLKDWQFCEYLCKKSLLISDCYVFTFHNRIYIEVTTFDFHLLKVLCTNTLCIR